MSDVPTSDVPMSDFKEPAADSAESASKDACFQQVADVANQMIDRHGKDFAMGAFLIAARFIAEGKSLSTMSSGK